MYATPQPASAPADPTCFLYAGVAFEISTAPGLTFELNPFHRDYSAPFDTGPAALSARVAVAGAPELARSGERTIFAEWSGSTARVRTRGVRAEVRQLAPRAFAASGLVGPNADGCSSLCTALAGALLDRIGGVVLHATGIEVDGGVVIFIGPSEAGKTTAANHCGGARAFARDRAAVYPTPTGWHVAPMSGGDEIQLPPSEHRVLPLRGVLRVRRGTEPRIESIALAASVGVLRESAQMTDRSPDGERALLDRLLAMSAEVPVGTIRTVLGDPLAERVRAWARGRA